MSLLSWAWSVQEMLRQLVQCSFWVSLCRYLLMRVTLKFGRLTTNDSSPQCRKDVGRHRPIYVEYGMKRKNTSCFPLSLSIDCLPLDLNLNLLHTFSWISFRFLTADLRVCNHESLHNHELFSCNSHSHPKCDISHVWVTFWRTSILTYDFSKTSN